MDLISIKFPRFFVKQDSAKINDEIEINADDSKHICTVLRMKAGEKAVLCGNDKTEFVSEIISAEKNLVKFKVLAVRENDSEPKTYVRLFQCVPKAEKLDFVVQKATELGVSEIIPVISRRCVSRPNNSKTGKTARLQKIAEQAAKQSGRGKIPLVREFTEFITALDFYKQPNLGIIFYENGGMKIGEIFKNHATVPTTVDIFIGSEGGFEPGEIKAAEEKGFIKASLGKLILRTETAPIAAVSIIMNLTDNI